MTCLAGIYFVGLAQAIPLKPTIKPQRRNIYFQRMPGRFSLP